MPIVEYALVLPVMLAVVLGGFDLGVAALNAQQLSFWVSNAATLGGRRAACCTDAASTLNFAIQQTGIPQTPPPIRYGDPPQVWHIAWNAGCGLYLSVSTKYQMSFLPITLPLNFVSCAPSCYQC